MASWFKLVWAMLLTSLLTAGSAAITYTPMKPPAYPLAVRNPFLNAWFPGDMVESLPLARPRFWAGNQLTWSVIASVGNETYNLFGIEYAERDTLNGTVVSVEYTSTKTTFVMDAGAAQFELVFLSPITPGDYMRQSMPFSYLTVNVIGLAHDEPVDIKIYSDVDDSWNGQNMELWQQTSSWKFSQSSRFPTWTITNEDAVEYAVGGPNWDMALWGQTMYSTAAAPVDTVTTAAGPCSEVRSAFIANGTLDGFGSRPWTPGGATGFAHDLGTVSENASVTFILGHYRDCEVNYMGDCRVGYYRSRYPDPVAAMDFFMEDVYYMESSAATIDSQIQSKAMAAGGQNYSDIITLSARQTFGALDETISKATMDTDDHMVFLKEISSDGNVNTMDVIYPAFPQFYVLDPEYIRLLLEPVVQYLASGNWTKPWVIHDIGSVYPMALGHPDGLEEDQPLEETGNLLILAAAYDSLSHNSDWAAKYKTLFQGYADYLISHGVQPVGQLSTDDAAGSPANQTHLAIKAAVGITAFGSMYKMDNYTQAGIAMASQIYDDKLGTDPAQTHFVLVYGEDESWATIFNLYPDVLLNLTTFNASAYEMQGQWYKTVRQEAGVPLDSELNWGKTDWMLWVGSIAGDHHVMDMFVNDVHAFLTNGLNDVPFSDRYYTDGDKAGVWSGGYQARPVVGGEWSATALLGTGLDLPVRK